MMARQVTRLLLVDDDALVREGVQGALANEADFELVASCPDAASALAFEGAFAMAIVDIGLPDESGVEVIRALRERHEGLELMAHTVFDDRRVVFDAIVAGAGSYLLKGGGHGELVAALRELRGGGAPMSPRIARFVVEAFREQGRVADRYALSARERQVLLLLEEGHTYQEVATELHVSRHTVHSHIKHIYEKLHAHDRAEALAKARLRGILPHTVRR